VAKKDPSLLGLEIQQKSLKPHAPSGPAMEEDAVKMLQQSNFRIRLCYNRIVGELLENS
jgi:hypothetical protein